MTVPPLPTPADLRELAEKARQASLALALARVRVSREWRRDAGRKHRP